MGVSCPPPTSHCKLVKKTGRARELLPTAGSARDAFILGDFTTPCTRVQPWGAGVNDDGILAPLLLVRASQLLDPGPVLLKSPGLTSYKRLASGCCWRQKGSSQMFGSLLQVACPWAAEPDLNTVVSDPTVYCTIALRLRAQRPDPASGLHPAGSSCACCYQWSKCAYPSSSAVPVPGMRHTSLHTQSSSQGGVFYHKRHCTGRPPQTDTETFEGGGSARL